MRPIISGKTPVAMGSSVPRCPIDRCPSRLRHRATTSCEVQPEGLSTTITPFSAMLLVLYVQEALVKCARRLAPARRVCALPCRPYRKPPAYDSVERRRSARYDSLRYVHAHRSEHHHLSFGIMDRLGRPASARWFYLSVRDGTRQIFGGDLQP